MTREQFEQWLNDLISLTTEFEHQLLETGFSVEIDSKIEAACNVLLGEFDKLKANQQRVTATWSIELNCYCPECGDFVDLLTAPDFWDGRHLEIEEHETDRSKDVEVWCPKCGKDFIVDLEY